MAAGSHTALCRKHHFLCRPERRVLPCPAPSLPAWAPGPGRLQSRQGGQCSFQPRECPPDQGEQDLRVSPPILREGLEHHGETCWGCLCWAVIYSTPSLCPAPRSPTNSCFVQELRHLQQADTFPTRVVNPGTRQRLCWSLASAQLCSARATKWLQGC